MKTPLEVLAFNVVEELFGVVAASVVDVADFFSRFSSFVRFSLPLGLRSHERSSVVAVAFKCDSRPFYKLGKKKKKSFILNVNN